MERSSVKATGGMMSHIMQKKAVDFEVDDLRGMNQSIINDLREASVSQSLFNVCLVLIIIYSQQTVNALVKQFKAGR